ncbi:MAG: VOC family protein [Bacteroidota bacterium]
MVQKLDHIVYAVPDLEATMNWFEEQTGVRPVFGGYHTTQGTKNALLKLGDQCYLEFLAADEKNTAITPPRWMGIDLIAQSRITRWAVQSTDLQKDSKILKSYDSKMGNTAGGQRKMTNGKLLTWELTMPLAEPEVEILPFLIDWQRSESHPTDSLEQHCHLVELKLTHPNPDSLQEVLGQLNLNINISKGAVNINAVIQSPKGLLVL